MTPEEHYERGLKLLADADSAFDCGRLDVAHIHATIALSNFGAASAGAALRGFALLQQHPDMAGLADPAPVDCGQVPCDHAPDGGNHPGVGGRDG